MATQATSLRATWCGQCGQSFCNSPHDPHFSFAPVLSFCVGIPCAWICGQCGPFGPSF